MSTKGGKDTQQRRSDNRRGRKNNQAAKDSQNAFVLELGLTESSTLAALDVPQSVRPGAVHISLLGANETIGNMLHRLSAIAQHPLAMQLTQENQEIYRKVFQYVATSRVAAAQTQVPYAAGHILEYVGVFTYDQFRFIDGRCGTLPRPLAWTLANIGKFKMFGVDNVPAMPYQDANQADLYGLVSGGYFNIICYVRLHGPGLPPIPEEDENAVRVISQFLPCITLDGNRRFNQRTLDFWQDQIPTQAEWMVFVNINASVREQGLAVTGFKVSTGTGSPSQTIRFPNLQTSVDVNHYYWLILAQNPTIRAAIVLRLGLDAHLPTALLRDRFIGNPKTAPFCGYATPVVYIDALLRD
uniref:Uncharacterized protein LOC114342416 n=1 Tax=Diabrotica virgifera virgifera TaxID=50390 RepID=A0A6P7GSH3_DIAVI